MATYFWIGGAGNLDTTSTANWSLSSGGAGGAGPPTNADIVTFNSSSGGGAIVQTENVSFLRMTATGFTGSFSGAGFTISLTGNNASIFTGDTTYTLITPLSFNCTYSGATGIRTFNPGATSEANSVNLRVSAGTDIFRSTGTVSFRDYNFTGFSGTLNISTRTVYGDTVFSGTMSFEAGASVLSFAATSAKSITTNGRTLDFPLTFNGVGGTWSFAGALTQGSSRAFTITNGTVKLKDGATSTVGVFTTSGTGAKTLQSTLDGTQATLSQASGTVSASYLTVKDIAATGGATWQAYLINSNVNGGNNSGWAFLTPAQMANRGLSLRLGLGL